MRTDNTHVLPILFVELVGGRKKKLVDQGLLKSAAAKIHSDTRMYQVSLTLESAAKQKQFLSMLCSSEEWSKYLESRKRQVRNSLEQTLNLATHSH